MQRDRDEYLLGFLRDHAAPCPSCGYELRGLQSPTCPECGERLVLRVGAEQPRMLLLLLSIVPGASGLIFGLLMSAALLSRILEGRSIGRTDYTFWTVYIFSWFMALVTVVLIARPRRFMGFSLRIRSGITAEILLASLIFAVWLFTVLR